MIQYPCHHCKGLMYLDTVHEGHEVPCPHCDARFVVPVGAVSGRAASSGGAVDAEWSPSEPATPSSLQVEAPRSRSSSSGPRVVRGEPMHPTRRSGGGRRGGRRRGRTSKSGGRAGAGAPVPRTRRGRAAYGGDDGTSILVMAIMGWLLCSFLAPIAWYMGEQLRERARMGGYPMPGPGNAGRILAKVQCILLLAVMAFALIGTILINVT